MKILKHSLQASPNLILNFPHSIEKNRKNEIKRKKGKGNDKRNLPQ